MSNCTRVECMGSNGCIDKCWKRKRQALEQSTEQEPVAHFGSAYVNENGVHITTVLGPVAIPQDAKLYTQPQEAAPLKPLTDDEIWKDDGIMAANSGYGATFETLRVVVRAIEAAHGIKENT